MPIDQFDITIMRNAIADARLEREATIAIKVDHVEELVDSWQNAESLNFEAENLGGEAESIIRERGYMGVAELISLSYEMATLLKDSLYQTEEIEDVCRRFDEIAA